MQPPPYPPQPQRPPQPPYGAGLPPTPGPAKPTWLSRNVGWVVSAGCLSLVLLGCLFVMSIFGVATTALKSSDAYSIALSTAEHDPVVIAELGSPLKAGWFVNGSVNVSGGAGHATLAIPLSGSVRSGKVNAVAEKAGGVWTFSSLNVTIDGRPGAIDLLPKVSGSGVPALGHS